MEEACSKSVAAWWWAADEAAEGLSGEAEMDLVAWVALFGGPILEDGQDPCRGRGRKGEGGGESWGGKSFLGEEEYRTYP